MRLRQTTLRAAAKLRTVLGLADIIVAVWLVCVCVLRVRGSGPKQTLARLKSCTVPNSG